MHENYELRHLRHFDIKTKTTVPSQLSRLDYLSRMFLYDRNYSFPQAGISCTSEGIPVYVVHIAINLCFPEPEAILLNAKV